jgi:short-chain Z-isoprenyl diphosphate synthase
MDSSGRAAGRAAKTPGHGDDPSNAAPVRRRLPIELLALQRLRAVVRAPLYGLYELRLRHEVLSRPLPRHVALIIDGNRRWAIREGFQDVGVGHRRGAEKILELLQWCIELGVAEVTIWALSVENLSRSTEELDALLDVLTERLAGLADRKRSSAPPMRVRVIGRREALPERLQQAIELAERATQESRGPMVTFALAYSGRDELVDACRDAVKELVDSGIAPAELPDSITKDLVARHLYTCGRPDPDLIIRTSGEVRLSGFLPWQSAHSEFYFCDAYWPAFREIDFLRALRTFQQRARRYGR